MSDARTVRLLAFAGKDTSKTLSSDLIDELLTLNGGAVRLAAADALDIVAADQALMVGVIDTPEVKVDGTKVAAALRSRAADLRMQHSALVEDADGEFSVVDFVPYPRRPELNEYPAAI